MALLKNISLGFFQPVFYWLALTSIVSPGSAFAYFDSGWRLEVDPEVNLEELYLSGAPDVEIQRDGNDYIADASAVLIIDFEKLQEVSLAYERYVEMGMPNLRESRVVESYGDELLIWTYLKQTTITSKHYMKAFIEDEVRGPGTFGITWRMLNEWNSDWPYPNQPGFERFEGSWYIERLDHRWPGAVYVRYYLSVEVDLFMPSWLIGSFIQGRVKDNIRDVILTLARAAAVRH